MRDVTMVVALTVVGGEREIDFDNVTTSLPTPPRKRARITTGLGFVDGVDHITPLREHAVWVPANAGTTVKSAQI